MPEYIEREAIWKEYLKFPIHFAGGAFVDAYRVQDAIKTLPAADVVEVVRCKDCKFYQRCESSLLGEVYVCTNQGDMRVQKEPADFCSWGEGKEGAEE